MAYNYEYPYTDPTRYNADWILQRIKDLTEDMRVFASINEIKYADPFEWSIARNYEQNTLTQDENGETYLSKKPVPVGIPISDTNYWIKVADFSRLADDIRKSIAEANDGASTTTTEARTTGELVWLNGFLYVVLRDMNIGDAYIIGSNVEQTTIEEETTAKFLTAIDLNNITVHGIITAPENLEIDSHGTLSIEADDTMSVNVGGNYTEIIAGEKNIGVNGNKIETVQGSETHTVSGIEMHNGRGFDLNTTNPLKYRTPTKINPIFDSIPMLDRNGNEYQVLVNKDVDLLISKNEPVNVLYLGFDNTGAIDNSSLFEQYTALYDLYFPSGVYKFSRTLKPKNSIFGVGNVFGVENRDLGRFTTLKYEGNTDYAIVLDGTLPDLILSGFNLKCNLQGGIHLNTSTYSVTRIEYITLEDVAKVGMYFNPTILQSRCVTVNECIVFGAGQLNTTGYWFTFNAPDCRITNCYTSQIRWSIRSNANILTMDNIHTWSGVIGAPVSDNWYRETKGLYLEGCTLYVTNLYMDTHFLPIYATGSRSTVFIQNLSIWYDDTIAGTTAKDGSFVYGPCDVYVDGGLVYPSEYLPNIGIYSNVKLNKVVIKTDDRMSATNCNKYPLMPSANADYYVNVNNSSMGYREIGSIALRAYGSAIYNISDNYGNVFDVKICKDSRGITANYKKIYGQDVPTLGYKTTTSGNVTILVLYRQYTGYFSHNISCKCSESANALNYNNIKRIDNSIYQTDFVTSGVTPISAEV